MRNVIASLFISLDGVVEAPEKWHFPYFNDEMGAAIGEGMASAGAFLLGRRTYEEWAAFWPGQDPAQNPMAPAINGMPKYVASSGSGELAWENSTRLTGEVADAVGSLKLDAGGDIAITGSATLVRSLLRDGLVDELRLMVHPVVVGSGGRLFDQDGPPVPLELVTCKPFATGVLNLAYRPAA